MVGHLCSPFPVARAGTVRRVQPSSRPSCSRWPLGRASLFPRHAWTDRVLCLASAVLTSSVGYPLKAATEIALDTVRNFLHASDKTSVSVARADGLLMTRTPRLNVSSFAATARGTKTSTSSSSRASSPPRRRCRGPSRTGTSAARAKSLYRLSYPQCSLISIALCTP